VRCISEGVGCISAIFLGISVNQRYFDNLQRQPFIVQRLQEKSQKPFWRYIKAQRTEPIGVTPLKEKGQVNSDPVKKASILAHQFRSVFTVDTVSDANTYLHGSSIPPLLDMYICEMGIKKLLKGVDPSKASGPDQIPCRLLH
jgi:hypothetical protein